MTVGGLIAIVGAMITISIFIAAIRSAARGKKRPPSLPAVGTSEGSKKCPSCAETIKMEALVCRYCGQKFAEEEVQAAKAEIAQRLDQQEKEREIRKLKKRAGVRRGWGVPLVGLAVLFFIALFAPAVFDSSRPAGDRWFGFVGGLPILVLLPGVIGLRLLSDVRKIRRELSGKLAQQQDMPSKLPRVVP